jgi:hypothetical protein
VRLHAEVPLLTLLALVHLGVALAALVLGGARRRDQGRIDHGASTQQQALALQQFVDGGEDLGPELLGFEQVAKAQDGALVGESVGPATKAGKVAKEGHVVQGFFHGRVAEVEPLLHEVDTQHGFNVERRAATAAFGAVRGDQGHQIGPRHEALHLQQEHAPTRRLVRLAQGQTRLLHAAHRPSHSAIAVAGLPGVYADLPQGTSQNPLFANDVGRQTNDLRNAGLPERGGFEKCHLAFSSPNGHR